MHMCFNERSDDSYIAEEHLHDVKRNGNEVYRCWQNWTLVCAEDVDVDVVNTDIHVCCERAKNATDL